MNKGPAFALVIGLSLWCAAPGAAQTRAAGAVKSEERSVTTDLDPAAERRVDFLCGGSVTASKPGIGKAFASPNEPAWLGYWTRQFREGMQPARLAQGLPSHALTRIQPLIMTLDRKPSRDVVGAAALTWQELACPTQTPPIVGQVLDVAVTVLSDFEDGRVELGVELACRHGTTRLVRASRVAVEVDASGRALRAWGLRLEAAQELRPRASPDARVAWPLQPAELTSRRPAWSLPGGAGWLVQLVWDARVGWVQDGGLPMIETEEPGRQGEEVLPMRVLVLLASSGKPGSVLLQGGTAEPLAARRPLLREPADDLTLSEQAGVWVLQRVALQAADVGPRRAGYQTWFIQGEQVAVWSTPLPVLDVEGLWRCHPTLDQRRLACQFLAAGAHVSVQVPDMTLLADPKQRRWVADVTGN